MKYLVAAYFWVFTLSFTFVLYLWIAVNQLIMMLTGQELDGRRHHRVATFWGQTVFKLTPGWRIEIDGMENIPKDRDPVVVVANHESMADILALFFLNTQFRWFAKYEIKKFPIVGQVMSWAGYIFIKRGSKASAAAAMKESSNVIRNNISMIFFPEGTRSKDGTLREFKLGAFKLAQDTLVDVLPVAIHGAGIMFPKGSGIPHPSTIKLKILPRVPGPKDEDDLVEYSSRIRDTIMTAHKELV
jgi:1-acyl-sn-glycerol-3-phosphate acyltransferase